MRKTAAVVISRTHADKRFITPLYSHRDHAKQSNHGIHGVYAWKFGNPRHARNGSSKLP
jgi:hypothetical protein